MIASILGRLAGFGGVLSLAWSISVGMFVAHILDKFGAPHAVQYVGGGAIGLVAFLVSAIQLGVLTAGAGMSAVFGSISKIGLVVSLILTACSIVFTSDILHWSGVKDFGFWYMFVDWNITVFLVVNMVFTAIKGGFKGAVAVVEELSHEVEQPRQD
jgi:hypothetical protein